MTACTAGSRHVAFIGLLLAVGYRLIGLWDAFILHFGGSAFFFNNFGSCLIGQGVQHDCWHRF
jgi:hypothetical protein